MAAIDPVALAEVRALAASGEARRIREAARLPRTVIADHVGVSHVTVQRWETGTRRPSGRPAIKYGRLLSRLRGAA